MGTKKVLNPIEVDGTVTAKEIVATQTGGTTKTYTSTAATTRWVLARVNNYAGNASCKLKIEVSGDNGSQTSIVSVLWAGTNNASIAVENTYTTNACIQKYFAVTPNSASYYTTAPPEIHIQQVSAAIRTIKATILEASGDVVLMDNLTTTGNTTNRVDREANVNTMIGTYSPSGYTASSYYAEQIQQNLNTTTKAHLLGTTRTTNGKGAPIFDTGVYLTTTAGEVAATNFSGKHSNLTLTPQTTGYTVAGGTTSKTLTVDADATVSALAPKASPALTGTPTAPTAAVGTNTTQIATTAFVRSEVDSRLAANDAMIFKGTLGTGGTVTALPSVPYNAGWTYKVITAGTYAGKTCEIGDMIICITDRASGATGSNDDWTVIQTNIDGAVTGPASATADRFASFNGTTGKIIKDSGYSASSFQPAGTYLTLYNSATNTSSIANWGTLTSANGYTHMAGATQASGNNSGSFAFASKGGQTSMQIDGFFYQNEGGKKVIDESYASSDNALAIIYDANGTGASGTSTSYARKDHKHAITLATGDSNGQVKIAGTNVDVKGLGSAAYTDSTAYLGSGTAVDKVRQVPWTTDQDGKEARILIKSGENSDTQITNYAYFVPGVTINGKTKAITAPGGFKGFVYNLGCWAGHTGQRNYNNTANGVTGMWYKVGSLTISSSYVDVNLKLRVWAGYADRGNATGVLRIHIRGGQYQVENVDIGWEHTMPGIDPNRFCIVYTKPVTGQSTLVTQTYELWYYNDVAWQIYRFDEITDGTNGSIEPKWTLTDNRTDSETTDLVLREVEGAYNFTAYRTNKGYDITYSSRAPQVIGPSSSTDAHVAVFDGTTGKAIKDSGFTIGKSVPSDAVFTDTNNKVTQTGTNSSNSYSILLKNTNNTTNETAGVNYVNTSNKLVTVKPSDGSITAPGGFIGNASTATEFSANKSVALTGDVTGSASSKAGWSVATTLANSGVTAGSYGPSADASPAHSGTFSVPYVTVDAKGRVTAASTKTITLPSDNNTDTNVTQRLQTGNYNLPLLMSYQVNTNTTGDITNISYRNNSIYANTSTGIITANGVNATQVGGTVRTYELQATGYKEVLTLDKDTYWTTNSGQAYVKALIEYSRVPFGSIATLDARKGIWMVKIEYSGNDHGVFIESVGDSVGTGDATLRYFRSYTPKNTNYGPRLAVALENANVKLYIRVTLLTGTPGWVVPASLGGDPGTTNYNAYTAEVGRYNYHWSNLKLAANITGGCDGRAGNSWDTLINDRFKYGEAVVGGSLVAVGSDGLTYKLRNTAKAFRLPLMGGRCTGTFAINANYGALNWQVRGIALTELTNASLQGTAFTVPTWAVGNTIYARGSLNSEGYFVPDGTLSNAMANGYTWIAIGQVEKINNDTVTYMTVSMYYQDAITLDSNGKLTHINGRQIYDSGNTDTLVKQTAQSSTTTTYPILMSAQSSPTSGTAYEAKYSTSCYIKSNELYSNGSAVQAKHSTLTLSLAANSWSNNSITVTATGVTASNDVIVSPAPASVSAYGEAGIYCSAQAANSLTFTCSTTPTAAISVNVLIFN